MSDPQPVDREWIAFRKTLEQAIGVPLGQYKEPQMKRRLDAVMKRRNIADWRAFSATIRSDKVVLEEVRDTLTINVTEFFRQPDRFDELEKTLLPVLLKENRPLKIWSAGCSIGCEPYTLSMLLEKLDPRGRHEIIATDVDMPALSRAKSGTGYHPNEIRGVPRPLMEKYFTEDAVGTFSVDTSLAKRISFRRHDLLKDRYPEKIDLILCRNVVIYFNTEAKKYIYDGFAKALRPGGYLFIGGSEMISGARDLGLHSTSTSMYQRAA